MTVLEIIRSSSFCSLLLNGTTCLDLVNLFLGLILGDIAGLSLALFSIVV
jgi:hypothetical protein